MVMKALLQVWCAATFACLAPAASLERLLPGRLTFEANAGQADSPVRFLARTAGYGVAISAREITIRAGSAAVQLEFARSQPTALEGINRLQGVVNYLAGGDPSHWLRRVPTFAQVRGRNLYPGVDILFRGSEGHLEYDLAAAPGADLSRIGIRFNGARAMRIDEQGDVVLDTPAGELRQKRPRIYQEGKLIEGRYRLAGDGEVALDVPHYDAGRALVIDPELVFAAQVEASGVSQAAGIAVDSKGNAYITGMTALPEFGGTATSYQLFVTKLDPSGHNILYSTYFGNSSFEDESVAGIAVDAAGSAYVTGTASQAGFSVTKGALNANSRTFVVKLNAAGDSMAYAATVAAGYTVAGIAADGQGNAYITGTTGGGLPVTPGAYWTQAPAYTGPLIFLPGGALFAVDGFVLKLNRQGTAVSYATYTNTAVTTVWLYTAPFGVTNAIAVDSSGNAYVTGSNYVLKFNATGTGLVYSSQTNPWGVFYRGNAIALDGQGNAYVAGTSDFGHAFVTKLDANGNSYFNTGNNLLIGEQYESATAVAVGASGNVFVAGNTTSLNLPLRSPVQEAFSPSTGFLAELDGSGNLLFSTYVGDTHFFQVTGLAVDPTGKPVLCGNTNAVQIFGNDANFYSGSMVPINSYFAKYDVSGIPTVRLDGLANLASQLTAPASPGELVSIRGAGFGTYTQLFFDGQPATMVPGAAVPTAIVSYALAGKGYTVAQVESGGQHSNTVLIPVVAAAPGIFTVNGTGTGQALAFNQDGSPNSESNPAKIGSVITFFATGAGQTSPPGVDGVLQRSTPATPVLPLKVYIFYMPVSTFQASVGPAPGFAADVLRIQATVPPLGLQFQSSGKVPLEIVGNSLPSGYNVTVWITQ